MAGRGRLIAHLKEISAGANLPTQTNVSSDEDGAHSLATTSSGQTPTSDKVMDSGLGTVSGSPLSSGRGRIMGRGALISSTSSSMVSILFKKKKT